MLPSDDEVSLTFRSGTGDRRELASSELAVARGHGYALLADLLARGPTEGSREAVRLSTPLADALDCYADSKALPADHHHAFGWNAPPLEGAYLDSARSIGGAATDALHTLFAEVEFLPDTRHVDVEHLSTALRCLAVLSRAEGEACRRGSAVAADRARLFAGRLMDEHLLRWVPLWACAVRRTRLAFPRALVDQIESLVRSHRVALGRPSLGFALPALPGLLDDETTSLRDIAAFLATPAQSGVMLTKDDIARLGRGVRVPRGFGDRTQLLANLLRESVRFEALHELLARIREELAVHSAAFGQGVDGIALDFTAPWRDRLEETQAVLRELERRADEFETDG